MTVRAGSKRILADITWTMRRGEHWALLGPNGSGKTTLLSLIQGDHPKSYALDLRLFGIRPVSTRALWRMRQRMGWLSPELHQHYPIEWSCLDVVCSGYSNSLGLHESCSPRRRRAAQALLRSFGLADRQDDALGELSFGDQRLVLLARAVVKRPRLLILDEPCQGLDGKRRARLLAAVDDLVGRTGASLVFVTHRFREMPRCLTHLLELKAGRVVRSELLRRPPRRRIR